tara:strand:+ start:2005 stop:2328 length:324 start_codon:yes stop_codon:yes gene_type:complete
MRLATLWGCPLAHVDAILPASELGLWHAWQYIEPFGFAAQDLQTAKLSRMILAAGGATDLPPLSEFITPDPDYREFDDALRSELEDERMIRNLKSVMRGGPDGKKND